MNTAKQKLKKCHECNVEKSCSEFYKNKTSADGMQHNCKDCQRDLKNKIIGKRLSLDTPTIIRAVKKCPSCTTVKLITEFYSDKTSSDGYKGYCKACHNHKNAEYRAKKKLQYIQPTEKPRYGLIDLNRVTMVDEFKRAKIIQEQLYDEQASLLDIAKKHRSVIVQRNSMELPKFKVVEKDLNFVK